MTRNLKEFVNHGSGAALRAGVCARPQHVAVLLGHFNGAAMLGEQLASLAAQSHRDWSLIVSDDGSSDRGMELARRFAVAQAPRPVRLVSGPGKGFARNFLSLAVQAGPMVPFAAFCDQDDVWLPDKLARALAALAEVPAGVPGLYCGRTMVCDRALRAIGPSPLFRRAPGFANALVQNIGGGNTMVLNRAALDLVQDTRRHAEGVVAHDWWVYQLVTGAGGRVVYDPEPTVLYRQHGANRIGANAGWRARSRRLGMLLQGRFRGWNAAHAAALAGAAHSLTPKARQTLALFTTAREGRLLQRLRALHRAGLYRQTTRGTAALWLAALFRRL